MGAASSFPRRVPRVISMERGGRGGDAKKSCNKLFYGEATAHKGGAAYIEERDADKQVSSIL